jgi:hypothetical protein
LLLLLGGGLLSWWWDLHIQLLLQLLRLVRVCGAVPADADPCKVPKQVGPTEVVEVTADLLLASCCCC